MRIEALIDKLPEESQKLLHYADSLTKAEANAVAAHDIVTNICVDNMYRKIFDKKLHKELGLVSEKLVRHSHLSTGWHKIDAKDEQIKMNLQDN